ncbi:MAG: hypothetical protein CVU38_09345 [Chloroflexi bacterium HGW-Chloroflexi-1]|nr:MAG: hypothetical protein CVU38_09345 [Chloroflexi bacterium HGW-Chloroflexi-1]
MRVDDLIRMPDIIEKLAAVHEVTQDEVEEVFRNRPRFRFIESGNIQGEDVYSAEGRTDVGRYLAVFFILKLTQQALIISARKMTGRERKRYGRK